MMMNTLRSGSLHGIPLIDPCHLHLRNEDERKVEIEEATINQVVADEVHKDHLITHVLLEVVQDLVLPDVAIINEVAESIEDAAEVVQDLDNVINYYIFIIFIYNIHLFKFLNQ